MQQQKLKLAIACAIVAALLGGASNAWADCSSDVSKVLQGAAFIRDGYELIAKVERNEDSEDVEHDLSAVDDLASELRTIDRIGPRSLTAEEKGDLDSETESSTAGTTSAELTNQTEQATGDEDRATDDEDDGSTPITPTTAGKALDAGLPSHSTLPPSSSLDEIQEARISITGGDVDDELTRELQQFDRIGPRSLTAEEKGRIGSEAESSTEGTIGAELTNQTEQATGDEDRATDDEDDGATPTTPTTAGKALDAGLPSHSTLPPSSSLDEIQEARISITGGDVDDELTRELQQFDRIGPRSLTAEEKGDLDSETESSTAGTTSAELTNQSEQATGDEDRATDDEDDGSPPITPTTAGKALDAGLPSHSTLPPSSSLDEIQKTDISSIGGDAEDDFTRELQQFDRTSLRSLTAEEKGRIGSEAESSTEGTTSAELTNQTEQATDDGSTAIAPATAGKARDAGLPSNSPLPPSPSSDEIQEAHISSTGGDADDDLARELQQFDRIGPRNLTAEEKRGIDSETESVTAGTKSAEQANQTAQATSDEDEGSTLTSPTTAGKALDAGLPSNSTLPPSSSLDEIQEAHISITGGDADDVLTRELQQFDRIGLRSLTTEEKGGIDSDAESVTARTKSAEQTNQTAQATSDEDEGSTPTTPTTAGNAHDAGLLSNSPLPPSSSLDESQEADVAIIGGDADDELTRELQQFDSRLLHLNADATEALQESGNLVTEPSSIASIDHSPTLSAEPPATPEEENMKELTEPIQSGPTNNTMPNEPHDGYFFDESAEDDVARTLREAIQMESDPNIKAELKRSYDDYMKILKK